MAKTSDIELAKKLGVKRIRAAVRLELAVRGDMILNQILDDYEKAFDAAVANEEPIELTGYQDFVRAGVERNLPLALIEG
jgi:hypothetical protein